MSLIHQVVEEATRRLVKEHNLAAEGLTEEQLAEAIRQALACGDFQRWVQQGTGAQQVVYLPFSMEQRRAFQVKELMDALTELRSLMQSVIDGEYTPDSFTLQPADAALARARAREGTA